MAFLGTPYKQHLPLLIILVIAALLRLLSLGQGEILTDEVFYGFRAIELVDFVEADYQTTPLEWFDPNIPSWTRYSFHDHPPLVFLLQHTSIKIFGETPYAIRFPSAIAGILSVVLVYLIASQLFSTRAAFIGASLMAVSVNSIYISRLALQESIVILFILLAIYALIRSRERDSYFLLAGVALGCALLTKFTALILLPIFFVILALFHKEAFSNKRFWKGVAIAIMFFLPVIYYNLKLYQAVGHFDFQFSYLFGQNPDVWKIAPGKDIGSLADRAKEFFPNLLATYSWLFLSISGIALLYSLVALLQKKKEGKEAYFEYALPVILVGILSLYMLYIGPSFRFLTLLSPFLVLAIVPLAQYLLQRQAMLALVFLPVLAFELFFSVNTFFLYPSTGSEGVTYSVVQNDTYHWGYRDVGAYLDAELEGKMPAVASTMVYQFLNELHDAQVEEYTKRGHEPYAALILYDENAFYVPQLWYFERLNIYHAWPVMKIGSFLKVQEVNPEFIDNFDTVYAIITTENTLLQWPITDTAKDFEEGLKARGHEPLSITNEAGKESFRIYTYSPVEEVRVE